MAGRGTIVRTVRVDQTVWDAAKNRAHAEGTDVAKVLRAALTEYAGAAPAEVKPKVQRYAISA